MARLNELKLNFPQIGTSSVVEKNSRTLIQSMKERIEKYYNAFINTQNQINEVENRVNILEDALEEKDQRDYTVQRIVSIEGVSPTGMVSPFAGSTAPEGWLICNGSAISRTTYGALFAVIGTVYGVGDGSTTFNIPDLRSMYVQGVGGADALGAGVGNPGSTIDLTHSHPVNITSGNNSATTVVQSGTGVTVAAEPHTHLVNGNTTAKNANPATADGVQVDIRPDTLVLHFIIKV